MPTNPTGSRFPWASVIGGASQIGVAAINAANTRYQNNASQRFAREQQEREYQQSLDFWNRQNQYNLPSAQMQRFSDAGLNPNLIYGQKNEAGSGSVPSARGAQFNSPDVSGIGSFLSSFQNAELKEVETDKVRAQTANLLEDSMLKHANRVESGARTDRSKYDLDYDKSMATWYSDAIKENVRKIQADTNMQLNENERREAMLGFNMAESVERVLSHRESRAKSSAERSRIRQAIVNLKKDATLKDFEADLLKFGVSRGHPMWAQMLARIANKVISSPKEKVAKGGNPFFGKVHPWIKSLIY